MVFSSHVFLFYFLPLVLALYYASPRTLRMPVLTLASYVFYGWANPWFILLLLGSTLVNFCFGNLIYGRWRLVGPVTRGPDGEPRASEGQRKLFLTLCIVGNLGALGFFKYYMFAAENVNRLLAALGGPTLVVLQVFLPVGISFYTFESISYGVDLYMGRARPAGVWVERQQPARGPAGRLAGELRAFHAFACYLAQFPHLVAGPIIRYQDLERQLHERTHTLEKFARGGFFFILGFAKKVLLANPVGEIADHAFQASSLPWTDAWWGLTAYAFQIYFDFSGYSDMAIGLGLLFGFEFPKNFDSPYKSQSLTEFWRRWHISLSTWLRDYLYIPLGGNRRGEVRTYANLLTVMLLGGLWHGASWNFLVWGGIHGVGLVLERRLGKTSLYARAPAAVRVALTFLLVNLAWVFFRADDLPAALRYTAALFGLSPATSGALLARGLLYSPYYLLTMAAGAGIAFFGIQTWDLSRRVTPLRAGLALGLFAWAAVALSTQTFNPFLYFQF